MIKHWQPANNFSKSTSGFYRILTSAGDVVIGYHVYKTYFQSFEDNHNFHLPIQAMFVQPCADPRPINTASEAVKKFSQWCSWLKLCKTVGYSR